MAHLPPPHTGYAFPGLENLHNDIYPSISPAQTPSLKQPGKVVLVTGASRGIGRAIALQYAHASVATLILVARSASNLSSLEKEIATIDSKIKVLTFAIDVSNADAVKTLADKVNSQEGRLDILINNAGADSPWVPLSQTEPASWWSTAEISLKAPYLFCQALLPLLTKTAKTQGKVDVINMSSIGAHILMPGASAYQTSKFALLRLTEFVDLESAGQGVVAFGMHPGGVVTDMSRDNAMLEGCEFCSLFSFLFLP
jgi:NAD(P)-dependent dehydrogenase (short-subunit alcohol dehydrogenase family)